MIQWGLQFLVYFKKTMCVYADMYMYIYVCVYMCLQVEISLQSSV